MEMHYRNPSPTAVYIVSSFANRCVLCYVTDVCVHTRKIGDFQARTSHLARTGNPKAEIITAVRLI